MRRLKGPELRMPDLRVPPFLRDLFYDLHDRRLLPLVGLVLVAIVAVPILLGGDAEIPPEPPAPAPASVSAVDLGAGDLTVVRAAPGLRDYRKRLSGRGPTDPFKQRYTGPVLRGAKLPEQTSTTSTSTTETSTTTTTDLPAPSSTPKSEPAPSPATGGAGDDGTGAKGGDDGSAKSSAYTIDVLIVHNGKKQTRRAVPQMTKLPGDKAPVAMFIGVAGGGKKALLLVSSDVVSVFGDGKCALGSETCDLLAVEPGFPQTFVYGENKSRYRINVLKIESAR